MEIGFLLKTSPSFEKRTMSAATGLCSSLFLTISVVAYPSPSCQKAPKECFITGRSLFVDCRTTRLAVTPGILLTIKKSLLDLGQSAVDALRDLLAGAVAGVDETCCADTPEVNSK